MLSAVLTTLRLHPRVGSAWRVNTAAGKLVRASGASQWIKFGFTGCPDVHGYMADGRALFIEVKRPSGAIRPEQQAFLEEASRHGCVAFVARSSQDVIEALGDRMQLTTAKEI